MRSGRFIVCPSVHGLTVIAALGPRQMPLMITYHVVFVAICGLAGVAGAFLPLAAAAVAAVTFAYPSLDRATLEMVYEAVYGIEAGEPLCVIESPYQRVEVIQDRLGNRHL